MMSLVSGLFGQVLYNVSGTVLLEDLRVALGPEGIVQPVPTVIIILELETLGAPLDVRRKKAQLPVTVKRALAIEIEASAAVHMDLSETIVFTMLNLNAHRAVLQNIVTMMEDRVVRYGTVVPNMQ